MARAISLDLRQRVCPAVAEGLSCHQAAARFKVSVSSAIRWQGWRRDEGSFAPQPQGGDRNSARIKAHAEFILAEYEARAFSHLTESSGIPKTPGV